jgi:para-aminobenzoate synthetase
VAITAMPAARSVGQPLQWRNLPDQPMPEVQVLLIDNYDSYTWNIVALIQEVTGVLPTVQFHDQVDLRPQVLESFSHVILGPGPGHPTKAEDVGDNYAALDRVSCPVLGICFGHQMLAHHLGGTVQASTEPAHGEISRIRHNNSGIFRGLPLEFDVVRYHSLSVTDPQEFNVAARSISDQAIMAISHPERPWFGVQFHPESICSHHGADLLRNFFALRSLP